MCAGDRGELEEGGQELLLVLAKLLVQNDRKMELVLFSQVRLILQGEERRILSTLTLRQVSVFAKLLRVTSKIQSSKHHPITQEEPLIVELETVRISWEGTLSARCHTLPWRAVAGWMESPAG